MSEFEWLPIPGHPRYQVSISGAVRSTKSGATRPMKPYAVTSGHLFVRLYDGTGAFVQRGVHQLVMEAFVGPCPSGQMVRHLDDVPTNNALSNLAYGTQVENQRDVVRLGHNRFANRTHCSRGHEYTAANTYIRPDRGDGRHRMCRTCISENSRQAAARRRLERV